MPLQSGLSVTIGSAKTGRLKWVAGDPIGAGSVAGLIEPTGHTGWLLCNGATIPNSGVYVTLFAMIGSKFGGAGILPSIIDGRVPIPKGASNFPTVGSSSGEINHVLSLAEYPSHTHADFDNLGPVHTPPGTLNIDGWPNESQANGPMTKTSAAAGGGGSHNNMPLYTVVGFVMVKY